MSATAYLACWLDVKYERKVGKALGRLAERGDWAGVTWGEPVRDAERELFKIEGRLALSADRPADAVFELLIAMQGVTNHCTVSGPWSVGDGTWLFSASASGAQVDAQSVVMLDAEITGTVSGGLYELP